ncbi:MAG: NYN domain-containing protein [Chloroflexi bacterium]|nr:NYN domain-containing protein [Chloroflexota bacterium]
MPEERVMVFIDGSNFYRCLKSQFGMANVDFLKLALLLCSNRKLIRIYYYNAVVRQEDGEERYKEQQRFFERLRDVPYLELRLGRLEKRGDTVVEKGIDVAIATDMLLRAYSNAYDTAILVSGDADLVPAVEGAKDLGKHVENAFVYIGHSRHLRQTCDRFTLLDKAMMDQCWLNK